MGELPPRLEDASFTGLTFEAQLDRVLLCYPGIARFLIENGRAITVHPEREDADQALQDFLMVAVGVLLLQRRALVLHAAACLLPAGAVLFAAASGRGKSTVLASLLARGHKLITDDIAPVRLTPYGAAVDVGAFSFKLFPDSFGRLGLLQHQAISLRRGVRKQSFAAPPATRAAAGPHVVAGVCVLDYDRTDSPTVDVLRGHERVAAIRAHRFAPKLVAGLGLDAAHFPTVAALARQGQVLRIRRSKGFESLDQVLGAIETHFRCRV
ncbi:MAG TPA: hypothetical protein VM364_16685 [Vicinamibacterales bacterium]|nr:hypothetical protein [Vicinamibacterales bacterium]HWI18156.1 hypothetical protein [Vicinamibacterales bacterium]